MELFKTIFATTLITIGAFLTLFYGIYMKRKETGDGFDTPEKRISLYGALGIGSALVGSGLIILLML